MKQAFAALALSTCGLALTASAHAGERSEHGHWFGGGEHHFGGHDHMGAPEIDPTSAVSALTLLIGGAVVLRSRFTKR